MKIELLKWSVVLATVAVLMIISPFVDAKAYSSGNSEIVGTWSWFTGDSVEIFANGTVRASGGNTGTWREEHAQGSAIYVINWNNGQYIDRLKLQGNRLEGSNQNGTHVWGERMSGQSVAGTWSWFTGESVEIFANGTVRASGGNTGTWRVEHAQGSVIYVINWNNGQYIDRLKLQGNRLEGSNQIGTHVWGERMGGQSVAGTWSWFTGESVEIFANGTVRASGGNTGTWRVEHAQGSVIYVINWNNGQYIDRLKLQGNRLEGTNQNGTHVWGERSGS